MEFAAPGFAEPPQKQSPEQPLNGMVPAWQLLTPLISSPPQQARSPGPPQCVARRQWLFDRKREFEH
jgi:hypothetical protein